MSSACSSIYLFHKNNSSRRNDSEWNAIRNEGIQRATQTKGKGSLQGMSWKPKCPFLYRLANSATQFLPLLPI